MTTSELYDIWVYLQAEPLFWLTLTIGAYLVGDWCYQKSNKFPLVNPVAISILIVSSTLFIFDIEYERYFSGAQFIHFMLGPATVALAIPIYKKWHLIVVNAKAIFVSVFVGSCFAVVSTYFIANGLGISEKVMLTMLPRSVTTPIAMGISEVIGGIPSLTAIMTITTGIIGATFGAFILDILRVNSASARGFGIGLGSHGVGTAKAMSQNAEAGVFAAVAMGLSGIVTSLIMPLFMRLIS
ncbi:LrgB family protein [Alteromonas sp. a30]|uniref:LrgB family protein n=1 Tax=Alteromonas sp. a30 TaxID=2730917 RepID=UPI002280A8F8|nr:LrgB family protein [Alteromonas sp. a30]MCY7294579.1 LrgB family protein [Alteromonas sp. a30]